MMATSLNYNRKRQRLLSNASSNSNSTTTKPHLIPKKQHYSSSINNEIINLDSDDDDYIFNDDISDNDNNNNNNNNHHYHDNDQSDDNIDVLIDDGMTDIADINDHFINNNNNININNHNVYNYNTFVNHDADITTDSNIDINIQNDNIFADILSNTTTSHYHDELNDDFPSAINSNKLQTTKTPNISTQLDYENFNIHHNSNSTGGADEEDNKINNININSIDDNEDVIDDNNLDDGDSYSDYFHKNLSQKSSTTRHLSFTAPINNLVNRFLKKSNKTISTTTTTISSPSSGSISTSYLSSSSPKKRTKSLPQLAYAKLTYSPALDLNEVSQKIGDVKASLINHYTPNYTYSSNNNNYDQHNNLNKRFNNLRKISFNQSNKSSTSSNPSFSSTSNSSATSSYDEKYLNHSKNDMQYVHLNNKNISQEDSKCDDDDGHYIVKNGSSFANGRFIIKKLLGQGTFGKVVKAYDNKTNSYVAIKIIKSIRKYREASKIELRVLTMLKKHDPSNKFQCIHLRECFDYRNHICIVTDLLKISLYDFMEKNQFLPFPGSHIQAISKQLLRSVAFLHDLNLIHTDLKPENILIKDSSYLKKPYQKLDSNDNETYFRKILKDPKIYTIDFGSAIFQDEYHSSIISTRHYRAPEIILGIGWSFPCDMWSVGSVLIELLTGDALFKTHENEQHLAMMQKVVGKPVDPPMVRKCIALYKNEHKNNNPNNRFDSSIVNSFSKRTGKLNFPKISTDKKLIQEVEQMKSIESIVEEKIGFKFNLKMTIRESMAYFNINSSQKDDYIFWYYYIDLVKKMLVFNPDDRITAREALNHKWFRLGILDDGI